MVLFYSDSPSTKNSLARRKYIFSFGSWTAGLTRFVIRALSSRRSWIRGRPRRRIRRLNKLSLVPQRRVLFPADSPASRQYFPHTTNTFFYPSNATGPKYILIATPWFRRKKESGSPLGNSPLLQNRPDTIISSLLPFPNTIIPAVNINLDNTYLTLASTETVASRIYTVFLRRISDEGVPTRDEACLSKLPVFLPRTASRIPT